MDFSKNKQMMIGIGALVLIAVVYLMFFQSSEQPDITVDEVADSSAELFFTNLAGTLDPVAFDTAIFSDPRFMALVDISTAVVPEESGRIDPFAPINGK